MRELMRMSRSPLEFHTLLDLGGAKLQPGSHLNTGPGRFPPHFISTRIGCNTGSAAFQRTQQASRRGGSRGTQAALAAHGPTIRGVHGRLNTSARPARLYFHSRFVFFRHLGTIVATAHLVTTHCPRVIWSARRDVDQLARTRILLTHVHGRNTSRRKRENPEETPSTSGLARHDSHTGGPRREFLWEACTLGKRAMAASRMSHFHQTKPRACTPPTKAKRGQFPAGSADFRMCESCRAMPLVGGFSRGLPFLPRFHSGAAPYSPQSPSSALKTSMLRAAQISATRGAGMQGRGKQEIPEKTRRPAASSGTITGATPPGIEPGLPWREASSLTATPPRPSMASPYCVYLWNFQCLPDPTMLWEESVWRSYMQSPVVVWLVSDYSLFAAEDDRPERTPNKAVDLYMGKGAIRATLTRTASASSFLRARCAEFQLGRKIEPAEGEECASYRWLSLHQAEECAAAHLQFLQADLSWRSQLVRHRSRVRTAMGSNPGEGMGSRRSCSQIFACGNPGGRQCRRSAGFLGDLPFPRPCIPALLHTHLATPSSALKLEDGLTAPAETSQRGGIPRASAAPDDAPRRAATVRRGAADTSHSFPYPLHKPRTASHSIYREQAIVTDADWCLGRHRNTDSESDPRSHRSRSSRRPFRRPATPTPTTDARPPTSRATAAFRNCWSTPTSSAFVHNKATACSKQAEPLTPKGEGIHARRHASRQRDWAAMAASLSVPLVKTITKNMLGKTGTFTPRAGCPFVTEYKCHLCLDDAAPRDIWACNSRRGWADTANFSNARLRGWTSEPGSIPGGVAPGFSHVRIVPEDAAGRRVSSGISLFPHLCITALLYIHLAPTSSALKNSLAANTARLELLGSVNYATKRAARISKWNANEGTRRHAHSTSVNSTGRQQSTECLEQNFFCTTGFPTSRDRNTHGINTPEKVEDNSGKEMIGGWSGGGRKWGAAMPRPAHNAPNLKSSLSAAFIFYCMYNAELRDWGCSKQRGLESR
ncbi:hypothetical protein PR048_018950 [Dryococelus australis]|uniref:Uncharacterized protein n=1 Tax=Dryococelus australis TaxID=614101 RepID=A0ABQ9H260_9NEOP|nr:hypothetical protein PR048_018950 [Dryococelus australis]